MNWRAAFEKYADDPRNGVVFDTYDQEGAAFLAGAKWFGDELEAQWMAVRVNGVRPHKAIDDVRAALSALDKEPSE